MRVEEVEVERLLVHAGTGPVPLGDGVTVVTGPNGAGKTALALEAICWVLWGKTARGTTPDGDAQVTFRAGGRRYVVARKRQGRRGAGLLLGEYAGGSSPVNLTGQTPTETQAKIDAAAGSWERFSATRVFSNRLRHRFGSATDKERKALLEGVLGLERYERAARSARHELGHRQDALQAARVEAAGAGAALAEARRALAAVPAPAGGGLALLRARHDRLGRAEAELRGRLASVRLGDLEARAEVLRRAHDQAGSDERVARQNRQGRSASLVTLVREGEQRLAMGDCPVCLTPGRDIPRDRLRAHYESEEAVVRREVEEAARREERAVAERAEIGEDLGRARRAAQDARGEAERLLADLREVEGDRARLAQLVALEEQRAGAEGRAAAAVLAAEAGARAAEEAERLAERGCLEAEAAALVLGSRGARVSRMAAALARLGREANRVLALMPVEGVGALRVEVSGTRELARGGEVDEVSVRVEPAGLVGGGEYDGTSDGERARLDVALMLGMSRVAGDGDGLVVFDEIFDSLDAQGLEAVVEVLLEMGRTRQVVVITHNPRFLDRLPAAAVWRVSRATGAAVVERSA